MIISRCSATSRPDSIRNPISPHSRTTQAPEQVVSPDVSGFESRRAHHLHKIHIVMSLRPGDRPFAIIPCSRFGRRTHHGIHIVMSLRPRDRNPLVCLVGVHGLRTLGSIRRGAARLRKRAIHEPSIIQRHEAVVETSDRITGAGATSTAPTACALC